MAYKTPVKVQEAWEKWGCPAYGANPAEAPPIAPSAVRLDGGARGEYGRKDKDGYARESASRSFFLSPPAPVAMRLLPSLDGFDGETFAEKWAARHKAMLARESEVD